MNLTAKKCIPCEGGVEPFDREKTKSYLRYVNDWRAVGGAQCISKVFKFSDFKTALAFVNDVGRIAEDEGHHPDIELSWGKVKLTLSTHAIKGLSENDFILAAKIDTLPS